MSKRQLNQREKHPTNRGCKWAPKCLECPFPLFDGKCLGDLKGLFQWKVLKENRDEIIYKSFCAGKDVKDIAKVWDLSTRRVRQLIADQRKKQ